MSALTQTSALTRLETLLLEPESAEAEVAADELLRLLLAKPLAGRALRYLVEQHAHREQLLEFIEHLERRVGDLAPHPQPPLRTPSTGLNASAPFTLPRKLHARADEEVVLLDASGFFSAEANRVVGIRPPQWVDDGMVTRMGAGLARGAACGANLPAAAVPEAGVAGPTPSERSGTRSGAGSPTCFEYPRHCDGVFVEQAWAEAAQAPQEDAPRAAAAWVANSNTNRMAFQASHDVQPFVASEFQWGDH